MRALSSLRRKARLRIDTRGMALVEFAIVAPVMIMFLIAAFDLGHTLYMKSVLQGAMQKAARDTALETGTSQAQRDLIDGKVRTAVGKLKKTMTVRFDRRFYRTFSDAAAARKEDFTDTNGNGVCDTGLPSDPNDGEPFDDRNSNGRLDADGGDAGQGGAKDAVLYTVTLDYPRILPLYNFIGVPKNVTIAASTVLQNQPYGDQKSYGAPTVGHCGP